MVKKINNFNDKYNISINVANNVLYLDIYNHMDNTKFNLKFNTLDLKLIDIANIDILYIYLLKCFIKVINYNIRFYEHSTELILEIDYIDETEYIEKYFKLYLTYYNDYYEKLIEEYDKKKLLKNYNTIPDMSINNDIFKYHIHKNDTSINDTSINDTSINNTSTNSLNDDSINDDSINDESLNDESLNDGYINDDSISKASECNVSENDNNYFSYVHNYFKDIVFLLKILCIDYEEAI